jgi:hypothetical protein
MKFFRFRNLKSIPEHPCYGYVYVLTMYQGRRRFPFSRFFSRFPVLNGQITGKNGKKV